MHINGTYTEVQKSLVVVVQHNGSIRVLACLCVIELFTYIRHDVVPGMEGPKEVISIA